MAVPDHIKINFRPRASADPVALQFLDAGRPVEAVEFSLQPIGVGGDPQHPLPQRDAHHWMAAAFAHAADHFLVGQHGAEGRAPVHRGFRLVGQTMSIAVARHGRFALLQAVIWNRKLGNRTASLRRRVKPSIEEHQKNPLRPPDVFGVGCGQFAAPVVAEAEHLELPPEGVNIPLGAFAGRRAGANCMLLRRQAEGIKPHWVHHTGALHPLKPRHDIGGSVALRMANMQAVAAGVGEHVEHIGLASPGQPGRGKCAVRFPPRLPLRFNARGLVSGHLILCGLLCYFGLDAAGGLKR